jgi:ankyrin repeat protein
MPNVRKAQRTSRSIYTAMRTVPLFEDVHRSTVYPGGVTLLRKQLEDENWNGAIRTMNLGISKNILEYPPSVSQTLLQHTFDRDRIDVFRKLLQKGADPNEDIYRPQGGVPFVSYIILSPAPLDQKEEFIRALASAKVNLNKLDYKNTSPLEYAIQIKELPLVRLLVELGVNYKDANKAGFTPLLTVITKGDIPILEYFMTLDGIDMDQQTGKKLYSPLKIATLNSKLPVFKLVLENVRNVDAKDNEGNTALHYAVMTKAKEKVKELLLAGANPRLTNKKNQNPMELAGEDPVLRALFA